MTQYADSIITPQELRASHLKRLYCAINRGLSDSYEQGFCLMSNYAVQTPDGRTNISQINLHDMSNVIQWLVETGYTVTTYHGGTPWLQEPRPDLVLYKIEWPNE